VCGGGGIQYWEKLRKELQSVDLAANSRSRWDLGLDLMATKITKFIFFWELLHRSVVCVSAHNLKSFNLVSFFFVHQDMIVHDLPIYIPHHPHPLPLTKLPNARATATDCSHVGGFVLFLLATICCSSSCQKMGGVVRGVREQDSRKSSH
jgi:hypothetical protein